MTNSNLRLIELLDESRMPVSRFIGDIMYYKCKICRNASENNSTGKHCWEFLGKPRGSCGPNDESFQPIPKKPEKPEKTCKDCEYETHSLFSQPCSICPESRNRPMFTPKKPIEEKSCNNCGRKNCQAETKLRGFGWCGNDYSGWQPIEKPVQATISPLVVNLKGLKGRIETPKPKENKMNRVKKVIRRYVMLCTVLVTARIAIWLNPWVCKLWQIITMAISEDKHFWDDCPSVSAASWFFTIVAIIAICASVYVFNQATAWIFGEK